MATETFVLIVDDDDAVRELCATIVSNVGFSPLVASSLAQARALLKEQEPDLVILDLRLPDGDGAQLLREVKKEHPETQVIVVTAYGTIRSAVAAMSQGAYDYITKPFSTPDMMRLLRKAAEKRRGVHPDLPELSCLETEGFHGIIGISSSMRKVYRLILRIADVESTVLIQGESGTGKELVARAIHASRPTSGEPFIPIDCNVLNENVIESELFGHVKGSFTGATRDRDGLFRVAGKGTVFLDEISEIPLEIQTKLLRAIQEREMKPVGSTRTIRFQARIVAATQRDLEAETRKGRFREDLFYRLNVIPIVIPPLRYRKEDIPVLARHFIRTFSAGKKTPRTISDEALAALVAYGWPGNVRELENCIEQIVALSSSPVINVEDLSVRITRRGNLLATPHDGKLLRAKPLRQLQREAILAALDETRGNRRQAARLLGIAESTLYAKLKEMRGAGLSPPPAREGGPWEPENMSG
jgi:two-component system response regulator HydG